MFNQVVEHGSLHSLANTGLVVFWRVRNQNNTFLESLLLLLVVLPETGRTFNFVFVTEVVDANAKIINK